MKVLHVGPKNYPPSHGGVEKIVYDLVQGMEEVESHVFTEWNGYADRQRVRPLEPGVRGALRQIRRYCRDEAIDIVHLHKDRYIPHALLLSLAGVRCVLTVHGCGWRLARWPLYLRIPMFILDCAACFWGPTVVFVGERDWRLFKRLFLFRRLRLIRNGVEVRCPCATERREALVYVGRLSSEKNVLNLIRCAESSAIPLDLYGPFDKHDPGFEIMVQETLTGCQYVRWHGPIPFDQVRPTIRQYRGFVNPSFSEGLPVSVLEAAAEGLYLVLSDIPQHRLLDFPACAYVDPHAMNLGALPGTLPNGAENRKRIEEAFGADKMVSSYLAVYQEMV